MIVDGSVITARLGLTL